ncbi:MAG: 3D domain-containing protein [Fluviicola sp.]
MKGILSGFLVVVHLMVISQTSPTDFLFPAPPNQKELTSQKLWSTQYYIHQFQSGGKIPIVYADGKPSGLFADTCDFCMASLEGTAFVKDSSGNSTIINFAKSGDSSFVNCRACKRFAASKLNVESWGRTLWSKSQGFGDGVKNYRLVPFRTIAVDKEVIPYGTVLYIPAARGKKILLPDGEEAVHDGYFFAGDTGGAIKKNHIDIFTGIYEGNPFPEVIKSNENKTVDAFIITDQTIVDALAGLHLKKAF